MVEDRTTSEHSEETEKKRLHVGFRFERDGACVPVGRSVDDDVLAGTGMRETKSIHCFD